MVAFLFAVLVARGDVVQPGPPCNDTRCARGEPVAYRSTYRDPSTPTSGNDPDELRALGYREVCSVGTGNYDHEVWCGTKGALPACLPEPKRAESIRPGPLTPPCSDGTLGTTCSDLAKCNIPAGFTPVCRWVPKTTAVPETLYCAPVVAPAPAVPSGEVTPRGRCDTAGPVASVLAGVLALAFSALSMRRSRK